MESLVGLRAELERKKQERLQQATTSAATGKLKLKGSKKTQPPPKNRNDGLQGTGEDQGANEEKMRAVLARKAALYDKLHGGTEVLEDDQLNGAFLVNFQKKIIDTVMEGKKKSATEGNSSKKKATNQEENPDDWVEYTDALGRSREVRRRDLPELEQQDEYLTGDHKKAPLKESEEMDPSVVDGLQSQFEEQCQDSVRRRWEKTEEINATKESLHYQDVRFDEARVHGVGFVALSGDEETRKEQQQMLKDLHTSALEAAKQHRAEAKRKEKTMEKRLAKIRQKKRLKRGLPVQDDQLKTPPPSDDEEEEVAPLLVPAPKNPAAEKREWDIGKELIGKFVEPADKQEDPFGRRNPLGGSIEASQEAWVDRQRMKREEDFAPPSSYGDASGSTSQSSFRNTSQSTSKHFEDVRQKRHNRLPAETEEIVNELEEREEVPAKKQKRVREGAAIPPPTSFDYFTPGMNTRKNYHSNWKQEKLMEEAIAKGLKKLKEGL